MDTRIKLDDTMMDIFCKMSDGNPGALSVCFQLQSETSKIDPVAVMPEVINLLGLDTLGIYGPRIWMLYKDFCKEDIVNVMAVLRAHQFGLLRESEINHAIDNWGEGVDLEDILSQVQERLPQFAS